MREQASAERIDTHTGYMIVKLGAAAGALFENALTSLGIRGKHVRVLGYIQDGTLSQQDLCRLTGMDRTTMVAVIDDLESLGYARRERATTDRRKHVVIRTDLGADALHDALTRLGEAQDRFFAPLSGEERARLHDLVARLFGSSDAVCEPEA
jgi:DNA-binding MarR family transcriptional regulator